MLLAAGCSDPLAVPGWDVGVRSRVFDVAVATPALYPVGVEVAGKRFHFAPWADAAYLDLRAICDSCPDEGRGLRSEITLDSTFTIVFGSEFESAVLDSGRLEVTYVPSLPAAASDSVSSSLAIAEFMGEDGQVLRRVTTPATLSGRTPTFLALDLSGMPIRKRMAIRVGWQSPASADSVTWSSEAGVHVSASLRGATSRSVFVEREAVPIDFTYDLTDLIDPSVVRRASDAALELVLVMPFALTGDAEMSVVGAEDTSRVITRIGPGESATTLLLGEEVLGRLLRAENTSLHVRSTLAPVDRLRVDADRRVRIRADLSLHLHADPIR